MNLEMNHVLRQTRLPFVDAVYHFMGIAGQYRAKFAPDQVTSTPAFNLRNWQSN